MEFIVVHKLVNDSKLLKLDSKEWLINVKVHTNVRKENKICFCKSTLPFRKDQPPHSCIEELCFLISTIIR